MSFTQLFIFLLIIQAIHGLATWKLYIKAGRQAWEAFVPVYNAIILMKIINRPWWWTILLFLPIVNLIMFPVIWVETARSFGKNTNLDTFLAIISLGFYNFYLNYLADVTYINDRSLQPRSEVGDWISSILFAIVAATIVHTYFIQPFVIPTSSLEKTLLIGDFLFVSKFHYGARTPQTSLALPMVHDSIPVVNTKSYVSDDDRTTRDESWANKTFLPYFRLPGFQNIKRNDIVVFNWPVDTVQDFFKVPKRGFIKPVDKKSNYVKRAVGIPGDSMAIKDGYIYTNGKKNVLPDRAKIQFYYSVTTKDELDQEFVDKNIHSQFWRFYNINVKYWDDPRLQEYFNKDNRAYLNEGSRDSLNIEVVGFVRNDDMQKFKMQPLLNKINVNLTEEEAQTLRNNPRVASVEKFNYQPKEDVFPHAPGYNWSFDNFGPIYIPEAGKTVDLNLEVLPLYERIISEYENNKISVKGNQIFINGEVATTYTFKQDYYWMMGDNRHNSQDARAWGYVPFDHVVGKPVLIWMSYDTNATGLNKIRWNRLFTTVHGSGKPVSYLIPVLILIALGYGFSKFRKRKKKS